MSGGRTLLWRPALSHPQEQSGGPHAGLLGTASPSNRLGPSKRSGQDLAQGLLLSSQVTQHMVEMLCDANHSLQLHSERPAVLWRTTGVPPGACPC